METTYTVEYAKSGRSTCKRSKEKIAQGSIRFGKVAPSPFNEEETVCHWFSPKPFFEMMRGMRKTTKKLESADELAGLGELNPEDREAVTNMIRDFWDASVVVTAPKKKAPAKKRQAEDGGDEEEKPDVKPKKPKAPPKPKNEPHPTEVVECALVAMKSMANELIAKARADGIKIPTDDAVARPAVGAILIQVQREGVGLGSFADGFVDLGLCLDALEKQHGTTKHDVPVDCAVEGNRALAMCFKEFSGYEFKAGDKFKGASSNKVFKAFCACDFLITSGKQVSSGKQKLANVGRGTGERVEEFLTTGAIAALDAFKAGA